MEFHAGKGGGVHGLIIRPDSITEAFLQSVADFTAALDGAHPEHLSLTNGSMYLDDEFRSKTYDATRHNINYIASTLAATIGRSQMDFWIVGPVVVVGPPDLSGWDTNIAADVSRLIYEIDLAFR